MNSDDECYYKILGVDKTANEKDIKSAWRKMSLKYHPDKLPQSEEEFGKSMMQKINEAYSILRDPSKRALYDKYGKKGLEMDNDVFKDFFGSKGRSFDPFSFSFGGRNRNSDTKIKPIEISVTLTLEEVFSGKNFSSEVIRRTCCRDCDGTGSKDKIDIRCKNCGGAGSIVESVGPGLFSEIKCKECTGSGINKNATLCSKCNGRIFVSEKIKITHKIPPGYCNGDVFEIQGHGNQAHPYSGLKEKRGSILVKIQEMQHEVFSRTTTGIRDILIRMDITLAESLCGFSKTFTHLDGRKLTIVENSITNPHAKKVVRYEGLPCKNNTMLKGNLLIMFNIQYPKTLSDEQRKAITLILGGKEEDLDIKCPDDSILLNMVNFSQDDMDNNFTSDQKGENEEEGCSIQ